MANQIINEVVSETLQAYYVGLINKIQASPVIDVRKNQRLINDDTFLPQKNNFRLFLETYQLSNSDTDNFEIIITKTIMLEFFEKQKANNCLSVTSCFGINKKIKNGGQFMLLQKGVFCKKNEKMSVFEIINSIFKNKQGRIEYYQDFNLSKKVPNSKYEKFTNKVEGFYLSSRWEEVAHGYALPVDAMIDILKDSNCLGNSENIKISFGLKFQNPSPDLLSSFTYYISDSDIQNANFYIKCSTDGGGAVGDCPPEIPCKPKPPEGE